MKTVRTYSNINDALLDQSWLKSNGIESIIPDELTALSSLPQLNISSGYPLAVLYYQFYWPITAILFVPSVGLLFLQSWARPAYIAAWGLGLFLLLFSQAHFVYPNAAFLGSLSTLIGGFICCTIYFTNASSYFGRSGAIPSD
jgi:hypothetical protein